jgi:hypothetical protein
VSAEFPEVVREIPPPHRTHLEPRNPVHEGLERREHFPGDGFPPKFPVVVDRLRTPGFVYGDGDRDSGRTLARPG